MSKANNNEANNNQNHCCWRKVTEGYSIKANAKYYLEHQNDRIIVLMPLLLCLD